MQGWTWLYQMNKKKVWMFVTILAVMISTAVFQSQAYLVHSASVNDLAANAGIWDCLNMYAGVFSTAVTASVNPTGTLAALSIVGMIQNANIYFPEQSWLVSAGEFLNGIPIINHMATLPIANPVAATILTVVTIVMYIVHGTSASKMFSKATIDNIEQWGGMIVTVGLSLMPLATTEVVAAGEVTMVVTQGTFAFMIFLSIVSAILSALAYTCIYGVIDAIELIGAALPIKGVNVVIQVLKSGLHIFLLLLRIFMPAISVIVSIWLVVIGAIAFYFLSILSTYYMYIYVKPLCKKVFNPTRLEKLVHKKLPRKVKKLYPDTEFALPVFSIPRIGKIRSKSILWLVIKDNQPYVMRYKWLKKPIEVSLAELNKNGDTLYLQKTFRFTRILTEDKKVELILSNEYANQWNTLLERLNLQDYKIVEERLKQEKVNAKSVREEEKRKKREERERAWQAKLEKFKL